MRIHNLIVWLALLVSTTAHAQISGSIKWEKGKDYTIYSEGDYAKVIYLSEAPFGGETGKPQIPFCIKTFLLPVNAQPSIQIQKVNRKLVEKDILLYPNQSPIPVGSDVPEWVEPDAAVYNSSLPFPGIYSEIISDREDFGYHLVTVKFYPMEYIPQKRELYSYELNYSITYSAQRSVIAIATERQSEYLNALDKDYVRSVIENKDALESTTPNIRMLLPKDGSSETSKLGRSATTSAVGERLPEYLIITSEGLKNAFQPLADWKTKKGIPAMIETVENISTSYPGSDLQEKIRNYLIYVKRTYGSLFVLLGGDTNVVPARVKQSRYYKNNDKVAVDYYYACVDNGNWNANGNSVYYESGDYNDVVDWGLSFKLGRAPVENENEATVFVNKVIQYEKGNENIDYSYVNNSMAADAFLSKNDNGQLNNDARSAIAGYYDRCPHLNRWLIYDHYNCDSKSESCINKHNSVYIDPLKKGEEFNRVNFLAALQNGGNSGLNYFHLVYHMDHSGYTSMGTSQKDKNETMTCLDADQLTNGKYHQILISGGCSPADITKDCIAEHFLNNPNGGAVAYLGNVDTGYSTEHSQFELFLEELYKLSSKETTRRYDLSILFEKAAKFNNVINYENSALHLFGDPEMQVWSDVPQSLNVSFSPTNIGSGNNTLTVNVSNLPADAKATVCIQKGDEVYIVKQIGNGSHPIALSSRSDGNLEVTVTAHNFKPFETSIPVVGSSIPSVSMNDLIYDDGRSGNSVGNGDGQLDAGETIAFTVKLKNASIRPVSGVNGVLRCSSDSIDIVTNSVSFGDIPAGAIKTSSSAFVFKIDCNMEERLRNGKNPVKFFLDITSNVSTKTETFYADVFAPDLRVGNQKVTWTSNGDLNIGAGETVRMNIDLMNAGKAETTGLKAVLVSNNTQATCSSSQISYPNIPFSLTKTNTGTFEFRTASTFIGNLDLTLKVTNAYGKTWSFPVNPLVRPSVVDETSIKFYPYSSSINVYWTPLSGAVGYNLYRSDTGENGTYRKLNTFPLTAAYYLDENLSGRTVYHYKVAAIAANGNEGAWTAASQMWTSYPTVSPFPQRITTDKYYQSETCPNIGDVDNDGKQEIFWVNECRDDRTSYLMGFRPNGEELYNIDNNVTTVSGFDKTSVMLKNQVAFGDLSATGEQNIVVSSWEDEVTLRNRNKVFCYSAFDKNGDGKPDLLWEKSIPESMFQSPVIANLDGSSDGTQEIVIKSHTTSDIFILDRNGNELRRLNPDSPKRNCNYSALAVSDLDNDGQMEIIASYDSLGIYIWRQDGTPFTENPFWGFGNMNLSSAPVVCDLNGDGKKELVFSQRQIATSRIYAISLEGNKTVAGWNGSQTIPYTTNSHGETLDHTLSVGDINNDGHLEVVILGHNQVRAWRHTGELLFSRDIDGLMPQEDYAGNIETPILADVDGDAVPDIVFCAEKSLYALHNDGTDIVGFPIIGENRFADTPCVGDIDNDGKNELIAGDNISNLFVWKTDGVPSAIEWGVKRGNPQNTGEYFASVCKPMLITTDTSWNGESPCGNVVVQSGKFVVSANQTMSLNETSTIFVRSGAVLEVDGGEILNAQVKILKGGKLIVKNNGHIRIRKFGKFEAEQGGRLECRKGMIVKSE